ncbi:MAG: PKD domain-containing protein [Thermoplasmata archaeon]|nr:PKD domain-containing protein [Thermoplasmata archaeon]
MLGKRLIIAAICLLYLAGGMAWVVPAESASDAPIIPTDAYGDYPPPSDADWIINQDTYVGNETWIIEKNITVMGGATLTLQNVTLRMNSTTSTGSDNRIEVLSGGTLVIQDNDGNNVTTGDASRIMRNDPNYGYLFIARDGGRLRIYNCIIEGCGRLSSPGWERAGLSVQTDDAIIDHNIISYPAERGIILYGSDAVVSNNTIEWCDTGILATAWSNGTIENNMITWSNTYGIWVHGVNNINPQPSNPLIQNNRIIKTGRDVINKGVAIQILNSCRPTIKNVTIEDWGEDGMYLNSKCAPFIEDVVFEGRNGNFGIVGGGSYNWINLTNSTILNCSSQCIRLSQSYAALLNSPFNQSQVLFDDLSSNLTVKWFLNSNVNDSFSNPVSNANIRIRDNANGTYDENYTTDINGYLNWTVLTEYFQKDINGDKDGDDPGERIDYSSYNITVSKPGYSTGYAEVNMNASKTVIITLTDIENPIADAGLNQTMSEDTIVYLDGSGSTDNVGIVNYTWSFYDGGPLVNLYGVNVSYVFAQPGNYTITLNISDASGNWDADICVIYVNDSTAPVADAGSEQSVNEDEVVYFDGSGSTDNVGVVWYNWTFGDGIYQNGANATPNHTYTNVGTYIVTLNVSDAAGNWATDTCLVFVKNVAPIANAGGNKTGNEGVTITFNGNASADTPSDNSTLTYVWYFGDGNSEAGKIVNHAYADNDVYNATLVVTDDNGCVDSDTCNVTVNNVAPVIMPVGNQTAQQGVPFTLRINATDVPADTLTFSDNTTLFDINPITGMIEFTPTNDDVGNHSVNITVVDDDGGVSHTILNITVKNTNDAPVIESIGQQTAVEDIEYTLQVNASDVDVSDDVLTYSLTAYPSGMSIEGTTGLISWTPTNADVGMHTITVKVEDSIGAFDTESFTIIVSNVNDAPTIITNSLANATEDRFYMAYIQVVDVDAGDSLIYSLDTYPVFLSIDSLTGLLFGMSDNDVVGTHQIIVNVTDGTAYVTQAINLTVINANDPPTLNYIPPQTATEDVPFSLQIVGQDVDAGDTLTYSLISSPIGMTINQATGLIAWTPTNDDVGTHTVIVRVSDASGAFVERTFQITVANVNDGPTIITTTIPAATEGLMYLATIQAEDVDGDALTFSFDSSPSFLSIDTKTGLIYGMPTNNDVGVHQIVVNVSDGTTFVTRPFNLTVLNVNDLPVITSYPITMAKPGAAYTYSVIAEDADTGDVLAFSLAEAPEGMTINSQTGKISWTPTEAQAGRTYQVVVQVSDGNGSTTQAFSIVVDELPVEPYRPLIDDYVWIGIIILLITIIMLMLFYLFNKEKEPE